jgi:hypothetical protein
VRESLTSILVTAAEEANLLHLRRRGGVVQHCSLGGWERGARRERDEAIACAACDGRSWGGKEGVLERCCRRWGRCKRDCF